MKATPTSSCLSIIRKHLKKLADANGYTLTFHDLRHLNASVMLMLGIPDKYAMERGGWATNTTLKNVYQHTFDEKRHAAPSFGGSVYVRVYTRIPTFQGNCSSNCVFPCYAGKNAILHEIVP